MDKNTKTVVILIVAVVLGAILLKLIFRFWWTFIIGAVCFGLGYAYALRNKKKK